MSAEIDNANVGNDPVLTLNDVKLTISHLYWATNGGVALEGTSQVDMVGDYCWLEKLTMQESCVFEVGTNAYINNYGNVANGLDVKEFLPEGYRFNAKGTRILTNRGMRQAIMYFVIAGSPIHSLPLHSIRIHMSMMAMKKTYRDSNL